MKYWTRTTHNFNNETREWEYVAPDWETIKEVDGSTKSILGIHALDSGRWHALWEIVSANKKYYDQYHESEIHMGESGFSEASILHDLNLFESKGLVKSKER